MLKEDPIESTRNILLIMSIQLSNSSAPIATVANFGKPEAWTVRVNAAFCASLSLSIVAVLLAMLSKQWIREYTRALAGVSNEKEQAMRRHFRYRGLERWKMAQLMSTIPTLIHISLLIFFYGLSDLLFHFHRAVAVIAAIIFSIGAILYILFITLAASFADCPYRSPLSNSVLTAIALARPHFADKSRERSTVQADPILVWRCLKWLIRLPDLYITPTVLEMIISTALPSTTIMEPTKEDCSSDVPWMPVVTELVHRFQRCPSLDDAAGRNVLHRSLAQLLLRESADVTLSPELQIFTAPLWRYGINMFRDLGTLRELNMWGSIWAMRSDPESYVSDRVWNAFMDIFTMPDSTIFVAFTAHIRWVARLAARERCGSMESYVLVLRQICIPIPKLPWRSQLSSIDSYPDLSPRLLRLSIELVLAFITLSATPPTLCEALQQSASRLSSTGTASPHTPSWFQAVQSRRLVRLSLGPVCRLLVRSQVTSVPDFLLCIRIILACDLDLDQESKSHAAAVLYWAWNRHHAYKKPRQGEQASSQMYDIAAQSLLHTLVVVLWRDIDPGDDVARLWPPSTHPPVPNRLQFRDAPASSYYQETGRRIDFDRWKMVIKAIENGWLSALDCDPDRATLRRQLLFGRKTEVGDTGLFHSWVFFIFDDLLVSEKRECIYAATAEDMREALRERWGLDERTEATETKTTTVAKIGIAQACNAGRPTITSS